MNTIRHGVGGTASPIAIIGMGCMFPGARDLTGFWRSIRRGEDGISEVPESHWSAADYYDPDPKRPDMIYCTRGGFLSPVDFDPTEFGIPPTILEATDTTQLLSLVIAKAALEDAGYGESRDYNRDRVSVILGVTGTQELALPLHARLGHPIWRRSLQEAGVAPDMAEDVIERIADAYVPWQENSFPGLLGNVVAGRIANRLNLRGTNCVVDAACASSLGAIHLAMLELGAGRSDMALAGGADTLNDIFMYMCFSKTPALSPTGDARPFSDAADGTVLGEGVGLLVLKRLTDAERDGDRIYAVLKGIGTSSDGRSQSIYAPHASGQARALREAYRLSSVDPATIGLVEAHGTGTTVGDVTEFEALERVYREDRVEGQWCALGSVKSQIGHTKAAAGVAGIIKTALAIYHRALPPTIKIDAPNPKLDVARSPFYLSTGLRPWIPARGQTRRAAVSAFGFGGSNYHAVLEEHGATLPAVAWDGSVQIVALSSETAPGLSSQLDEWKLFLTGDRIDEAVLAYRACQSRRSFTIGHAHRLVLVLERGMDGAALVAEARAGLNAGEIEPALSSKGLYYGAGAPDGGLAFLFPGQGSQYVNMGLELCCIFPELSQSIAEAEGAVEDVESRLYEQVYPRSSFDEDTRRLQAAALTRTDVAQPALGAVGLGMARILERFGLVPDAVAGHSYGELLALCVAGRFDSATLHRLSRLRGRLMAEGDGGAMLAVMAGVEELQRLMDEERLELVIANRNAPMQQVLSGDREAIGRAVECCKSRCLSVMPLRVSGAFHSPMIEGAVQPFRNALEAVSFEPGQLPVFANTTGRAYPEEVAEARRLLAEQLIRPVDFVGEIEGLYESGIRTFVEVGPKSVLTGLVGAILGNRPHAACAMDASGGPVFHRSGGRKSSLVDLARLLARLAAGGHSVKLSRWERAVAEPRIPRMMVPLVGANYRASAAGGLPARGVAAVDRDERRRREEEIQSPAVERGDRGYTHPHEGRSSSTQGPLHSHRLETGATGLDSDSADRQKTGLSYPPEGHEEKDSMREDSGLTDDPLEKPAMQVDSVARKANEERVKGHARPDEKGIPHPPGVIPEALRLVREGIHAMQVLQEQTAVAHRCFLEGQEQAHRSLQVLLEQQRRWLEQPAMGLSAESPESPAPIPDPVTPVSNRCEPDPVTPVFKPYEPELVVPVSKRGEPEPLTNDPVQSSFERGAIASQVVEVVCEKTGYPAEMVELEMDIEADLGVDSIKRVEIIAALEERLPGFGGIQPERMGEIRTLNQIVDFVVCGLSEAVSASDASPPPTPAPAQVATRDAAGDVAGVLMEVVAGLTGYPREMLEPDMDLEGDLGIDSIKRVEILSALEARIPDLPPVQPDQMGSLRTLGQIIESCGSASDSNEGTHSVPHRLETGATGLETGATGLETGASTPVEDMGNQPDLNRRVLHSVPLPPVSLGRLAIAPGSEILVTNDDRGLSRAIVEQLTAGGQAARLVPVGSEIEEDGDIGGLILVAPATGAGPALWNPETEDFLTSAFAMMRAAGPGLLRSTVHGGAILATVSRMDGGFGLIGGDYDAAQGGLAGLVKTAAREWEAVACRALDVDVRWQDCPAAAAAIVAELTGDGPMEVGLDAGVRRGLELREARASAGSPAIAEGDVVVITGGARGVTAAAALALARRYQPTLVLLGRTRLSEAEPPWLAGLESEREIKSAIRANVFGENVKPRPKELKAAYARIMAEREIGRNLDRLAAMGVRAVYRGVDVCDAAAVRAVMGEVQSALGPVRGLIHGAGAIQDSRIENKTPEQFASVLGPKVAGLRHLLDALDTESLRHVVLFSSVSGRCGNAGQADYAAANEVLNKAAWRLAARLPTARVVSLNWGPWEGGMVTPALQAEFERRGVTLIPMAAGGACVADELAHAGNGSVEIVLGASFDMPGPGGSDRVGVEGTVPTGVREEMDAGLRLAFEHPLDLEGHPFLRSHVLDGRPVLPTAMMMEWMAHAALHLNPGLRFLGMDELRILKGVIYNGASQRLRFYVGRPRRSGEVYDVEVSICGTDDGTGEGAEAPHARANVVLTTRRAAPPPVEIPRDLTTRVYERGVEGAYRDVLFHGDLFRGIRRVQGFSQRGMVAEVKTAGSPGDWMAEPLRSDWLADPLVIDSAFQLAILWCHEEMGAVSLPSFLGRYRQFCDRFPIDGVTIAMQVRRRDPKKMTGDLTFLSPDGSVLARMEGYECTVDVGLGAAFRSSGIVNSVPARRDRPDR